MTSDKKLSFIMGVCLTLTLFTLVSQFSMTAEANPEFNDEFLMDEANSDPNVISPPYSLATNQSNFPHSIPSAYTYYITGNMDNLVTFSIEDIMEDRVEDTVTYWNYTILKTTVECYNLSNVYTHSQVFQQSSAYWTNWNLTVPNISPQLTLPNITLIENATEIVSYLNETFFNSTDYNLNYDISENAVNITGEFQGMTFYIYMEFNLEYGVMTQYSYWWQTYEMSMTLVESPFLTDFENSPNIFNVKKGQTMTYSTNVSQELGQTDYTITFEGIYYRRFIAYNFVLAEHIWTTEDDPWASMDVIGLWSDEEGTTLKNTLLLPNNVNLTQIELIIMDLQEYDVEGYTLEDFNVTIEHSGQGNPHIVQYIYAKIDDCIIQTFALTTENAYDYFMLVDSSNYRNDPKYNQYSILPNDSIYYLERESDIINNITSIHFSCYTITAVFEWNEYLVFMANVYQGLDLYNLELIATQQIIGILYTNNSDLENSLYLNPIDPSLIDLNGTELTAYPMDYFVIQPSNLKFETHSEELITWMNSAEKTVISTNILENRVYCSFEDDLGVKQEIFLKSEWNLLHYYYSALYMINSVGKRDMLEETEISLFSINLQDSDPNSDIEWGISTGDSLTYALQISNSSDINYTKTDILDIVPLIFDTYLIFGGEYIWNADEFSWDPSLPLLSLGDGSSIPLDILNIFGNQISPSLYFPLFLPLNIFQIWLDTYDSMINAYQIRFPELNPLEDIFIDKENIQIKIYNPTSNTLAQEIQTFYNELGIMQDQITSYFDGDGNCVGWERKVLVDGPGSNGEAFLNVSGYIPINMTDIPFIDAVDTNTTDDITDDTTQTNSESSFFGDIPPAAFATVGFVALLGAGTAVIIKKK